MENQEYQLFFSQDSPWTKEEKAKIQETIIRVFAEYKYDIRNILRDRQEGVEHVEVTIIENLMAVRVPEIFEKDNYWSRFLKAHDEAAKRGLLIDPVYKPVKYEYIISLISLDSLDYDIRNLVEAVSEYTKVLRIHRHFIDENFKTAQIAHTHLFILLNLQKKIYFEQGKLLYLDETEDERCILTVPLVFSMEKYGEEAQAFMKDIHDFLKQMERKPYYQPFMLSPKSMRDEHPEQFKYLEDNELPF